MRKYILKTSIMALSLMMAQAASAEIGARVVSEYRNQPGKIRFESRSKKFGNVERGVQLHHNFKFTNKGDGELKIIGVHSSCGCTVTDIDSDKVYAPGESGILRVQLDTTDFSGDLNKTVTVMTDQKRNSVRVLRLRANVKNPIAVNPPLIDFGEIHSDMTSHRRIHLKALGNRNFDVFDVKHSKSVDVKLSKASEGNWYADIYLKHQEPGPLKEVIYLETTLPHLERVAVPLVGKVKGKIGHYPKYIEFGAVRDKKGKARTLKLTGNNEFKVLDIVMNMEVNGEEVDAKDFISVKFDEKAKSKHKMALNIDNSKDLAGSVYGDIELITDHPNHKTIKLDFFAFFKD